MVNRPKTFDFLGFTHYCSCSKRGRFRVKRKTSGKKLRASVQRMKEWLRLNMHKPLKIIIEDLNRKLIGYYRYYGITDNVHSLKQFSDCVKRQLFWTLNRRSQSRSYSWETFNQMKKECHIVAPKIYVSIFELKETISYIL